MHLRIFDRNIARRILIEIMEVKASEGLSESTPSSEATIKH
jgi:hypothetical protein